MSYFGMIVIDIQFSIVRIIGTPRRTDQTTFLAQRLIGNSSRLFDPYNGDIIIKDTLLVTQVRSHHI